MFQKILVSLRREINRYRYTLLTAKAEKLCFSHNELKQEGYYSQAGQDKWIAEHLYFGKKEGVFVDIGAHDGIAFSNTYFFEKMGWNGFAIEPNPEVYARLANNRRCTVINGCIAPKTGKNIFRVVTGYPEMLSGLVSEYDVRHLERIEREILLHDGTYKDIELTCYSFNDLMDNNCITNIDYLNIDVEGVEYKILSSIDFDRITIGALSVENNYIDCKIPELLIRSGFKLCAIAGDELCRNCKVFP